MKRLRIDFNPRNRDRLCEVLDEQLSQGFKLEKAHSNLGYLTFMPFESNEVINYEVVCRAVYDDYFPEPWIDCGSVSCWGIFRFDGDGEKPVPETPEPAMSEEQLIRKGRRRVLVTAITDMALAILNLVLYLPEIINSAAFLVGEYMPNGRWFVPLCFLAAGILGFIQYFENKKDTQNKSVWSKRKWFSQYVLPWIFVVPFIVLMIFVFFRLGKNEKPIALPDERLPFSERAEYGTVVRSLAGNIYRYDGGEIYQYDRAFLYDVRSEKLAERLFEEAAEDKNYGEWQNGRFYYHNHRTEISADKYENLDRILSCADDQPYELLHGMVVVLRGDQVLGYCYDKEEYTEEEFLAELNDFYGKTAE